MPKDSNNLPVKLSKYDRALCFEYIVSSILRFKRTSQIIAEVQLKWKLSTRVINTKIRKAKDYIATRPLPPPEQLISAHIAAREELLRQTDDKDIQRKILNDIAKLQGLDSSNINISLRSTPATQLPDNKLIEIVLDSND